LVCSEIIKGAYDATLFEDVVFKMLSHLRTDPETSSKNIVLFLDNAKFHKHSQVLETCRSLKVNVLFNAEYSPWLNPIEIFFGFVKKNLLKKLTNTK
jgi:transposase